jgi:hypothetical protein
MVLSLFLFLFLLSLPPPSHLIPSRKGQPVVTCLNTHGEDRFTRQHEAAEDEGTDADTCHTIDDETCGKEEMSTPK